MMWWLYLILFGVSYLLFEWRARRQLADDKRAADDKWQAERLLMAYNKAEEPWKRQMHEIMQGDRIVFERGAYQHWGIADGNGNVIHLWNPSADFELNFANFMGIASGNTDSSLSPSLLITDIRYVRGGSHHGIAMTRQLHHNGHHHDSDSDNDSNDRTVSRASPFFIDNSDDTITPTIIANSNTDAPAVSSSSSSSSSSNSNNSSNMRVWRAFSGAETLRRARSAIGDPARYSLFTRNCEHFVNWCRYDQCSSKQVINATTQMADGLHMAGAALAMIGGLFAAKQLGITKIGNSCTTNDNTTTATSSTSSNVNNNNNNNDGKSSEQRL